MQQYAKFKEIDDYKVNDYLQKGWEVINSVKTQGVETEYIKYHMGYPYSKKVENLIAVLDKYEKLGCKKILFDATAHDLEDSVDNYELVSYGNKSTTPLAQFMNHYLELVEDQEKKFYVRKREDDDELMF